MKITLREVSNKKTCLCLMKIILREVSNKKNCLCLMKMTLREESKNFFCVFNEIYGATGKNYSER